MISTLVIIDTNVIVAGLITTDTQSPVARILDAALAGKIPCLISTPLLREYRQVLLRPRISELHRLAEGEIDGILLTIAENAIVREPDWANISAPDIGDQHLWNLLAVEKKAILVTGDRRLLENPPEDYSVLSPKQFVEITVL